VPQHVTRLVVWFVVDYFPTPRVWVPQHIARLVVWLVIDYFSHGARPGASARRAARH
jgi:hypothetical protein